VKLTVEGAAAMVLIATEPVGMTPCPSATVTVTVALGDPALLGGVNVTVVEPVAPVLEVVSARVPAVVLRVSGTPGCLEAIFAVMVIGDVPATKLVFDAVTVNAPGAAIE